jgi:hypothetical protein
MAPWSQSGDIPTTLYLVDVKIIIGMKKIAIQIFVKSDISF